jgi:hypothetical protein
MKVGMSTRRKGTEMNPAFKDLAVYIGRIAIATILFYTGLIHASQPYLFIYSLSAYQIIPIAIAGAFGLLLPYLHIILAVSIFSRLADRAALLFSALLFGTYACAQCFVLLKGVPIDCGCFGYSRRPVTWESASIPFLLAGVALFLSYASSRTNIGTEIRGSLSAGHGV